METQEFVRTFLIILAGVIATGIIAFIGMVVWYVKAKPEVEHIKTSLEKKAEAAELLRNNLELERKRDDDLRLKAALDGKRDIGDCDFIRKGCQPLIMAELKGMQNSILRLSEGQIKIAEKLETWMLRNGK